MNVKNRRVSLVNKRSNIFSAFKIQLNVNFWEVSFVSHGWLCEGFPLILYMVWGTSTSTLLRYANSKHCSQSSGLIVNKKRRLSKVRVFIEYSNHSWQPVDSSFINWQVFVVVNNWALQTTRRGVKWRFLHLSVDFSCLVNLCKFNPTAYTAGVGFWQRKVHSWWGGGWWIYGETSNHLNQDCPTAERSLAALQRSARSGQMSLRAGGRI